MSIVPSGKTPAPKGVLRPIVRRFASRAAMGAAAARDAADAIRERLAAGHDVRMIFAAAPSQQEMLDALTREPGIDWSRVTAFHMDDYIGLPSNAPQLFANWLRLHLFDRVSFGAIHVIDASGDPGKVAADYAALLAAAPIDIVCLGVGVNGHLAFNDPPVADLDDPLDVKIVELDDICRQQQVDDGCFARFEDVPATAITLTIPRLLRAGRLFCVVPGRAKRDAVRRALNDPIGPACPATALRNHPDCTLYLDAESDSDG